MNLAWAWHEIVSDYVRATLAWLETKGKANLAKLVAEVSEASSSSHVPSPPTPPHPHPTQKGCLQLHSSHSHHRLRL